MPSWIGFDSKDLIRGGGDQGKKFISTIGTSIEVFDLMEFDHVYDKAIEATFKKFGLEMKRKVYYFQYFCKLFGLDDAREICINFMQRVKNHIFDIGVYFANISPIRTPQIYMYGTDRKKAIVPTKKFLSSLTNPFPYISAWKYSQQNQNTNSTFILDHFQGKQTISWAIFWLKKPIMYYRGDQCNSVISTADMLAGLVDQCLYGERISMETIERILSDELYLKGKVYIIGSQDLRWIVPISRKAINTVRFVKHPIYFIINEKRPSMVEYKEAKDQLEFSPLFDLVTSKAFENNGCVKLYDQTEDYKLLKSTDRIIYYGDKGKEIAESLMAQYGLNHVFDFRIEKEKIQ